MRPFVLSALVALSVAVTSCSPAEPAAVPSLVPLPAAMTVQGGAFSPSGPVTIVAGAEISRHADLLSALVRDTGGPETGVVPDGEGPVRLSIAPDGRSEAYRLRVSEDGIELTGSDPAGLFYGLQTLRQLMPVPGSGAEWSVPAVEIDDAPRFAYRGLQLDVGRHFFPVEFVKKYLDRMAELKLNTFHWHLTEDQGWRAEILAYPRLTEVGSCRKETVLEKNYDPYVGDGIEHCGFYTQDQMREIVAYAADRYITVIPEIEMPGHAVAALAAYPELGCSPEPREVSTTWGIHDDVFCPSEATFAFLEGVLTEIMGIFPSTFIHIGGDEVPKTRWEESALAQEIIRREGLADELELQSWFVQRIERFLSANGRRLVGWDEILEGGLAPGATVMSWRGTEGGIAAARMGHDVIMSPTRHLYFDFYQGPKETEPISADWSGYPLPLAQVYEFDPVPAELTPEEARHVLGAQGNVWTEQMKTPEKVEYMVFPRAHALAEMVWTPQPKRDHADFLRRLPAVLERHAATGTAYRALDPAP